MTTVIITNVYCLYEDSKPRREEEESEEGQDLATYIAARACGVTDHVASESPHQGDKRPVTLQQA
jgi:hypothetical protein